MGDINGDGETDAIDLLLVKRDILGTQKINEENKKKAGDINKDNTIDAIDLLLIKRKLLGTQNIEI